MKQLKNDGFANVKIKVDDVEYSVGGHHSGPVDYTEVRFNVTIDNEFYFLDDVSIIKHHGEGNHPFYTNEENVALVEDLKECLAANIKKSLTLVLVTGGREYDDVGTVFDCLTQLDEQFERMIVVHGNARGADKLAYKVCDEVGIEQAAIPAAWKKYHKASGPIRNRLMLDLFNIDLVVAFPGGTGTADMCEQAEAKGIPVLTPDDLLQK